jgi:hypothetical protein
MNEKTKLIQTAKPAEPKFLRLVYDEEMKRVRRQVSACRCLPGQVLPKSKSEHAVCGNCGGAILTPREKEYLRALGGTSLRKVG